MPNWLDGKTIAVLTTMLTVGLALGTMMQTVHSRLGSEIQNLRTELSKEIQNLRMELGNDINRLDGRVDKLDDRLRSVEVGVATIQTTMAGFDSRMRVVERHARHETDAPAPDGSGG